MSHDDSSSFNAPVSHSPRVPTGRKPFPRWLIPFFVVDTCIVVGVLYWVYGSSSPANTSGADSSIVEEVRGAPIDVSINGDSPESAPSADEEFGNFDDAFWDDVDDDTMAAAVTTSTASAQIPPAGIEFLFGSQQQLPRPTIERPENKDFTPTSFEDIGNWKYQRDWSGISVGGGAAKIPANVRAWNGRKIAILGYMQPLELDDNNRVRSFMLMRNQAACCYGAPITLADWIEVRAAEGESFDTMLHKPITVLGTLDVGERLVDNFAVSVFRMSPARILPPGVSP